MSSGLEDGRLILDWLSVTFPVETGLRIVRELFGEWRERSCGIRGYECSGELPCGGVVGWSPSRPEQKVHLQLSSDHLGRARELNNELEDVAAFLRNLLDLGGSFRRVDFALDDRSGQLDMETMRRYAEEGNMTTRWRKIIGIRGLAGTQGETLGFGSRVSDSYLRIYDKQAERLQAGKEDPGHWIRVELELKNERAQAAIEGYLHEGAPFIIGTLRGMLQFRERREQANKTRWPVCRWWGEFLDWVGKRSLSLPEPEPSVERSWDWMQRQWPRAMARLVAAEGGSMDRVYELYERGKEKLTEADQILIEQHQKRLVRQGQGRAAHEGR